jgi:hypothetical protein
VSDEPKLRVFSQGEVNAILSRAVEQQSPDGGLAYDELVDVARQAGIAPSAIEAAVRDFDEAGPVEREGERVTKEIAANRWGALRGFAIHFTAFTMTSVFLIFLNATFGGPPWALIPILGWAIGLTIHFVAVLFGHVFPDPRRVERVRDRLRRRDERTRKLDARDRRREDKDRRRDEKRAPSEASGQLADSAKDLGVAMQRGMATLLADVAKTIHEEVDRAQEAKRTPNVRVAPRSRVAGDAREPDEHDLSDEQSAETRNARERNR